LVVVEPPVREPPPEPIAKVTLTPETALPLASLTMTLGAIETAVPAVADWPLPELTAIWVAVAIGVTEEEAAEGAPVPAALVAVTVKV
jgi:hypothetical protein